MEQTTITIMDGSEQKEITFCPDDFKITLIAALAENNVIGNDLEMPWRIPADLKHFKATTLNHVIVMGSKTWESFGRKALPNRNHIIMSRDPDNIWISPDDCGRASTACDIDHAVEQAMGWAHLNGQDEIFIVGGAEIYAQLLGWADRMILTRIEGEIPGNKFFPTFGEEWIGTPREIDGSPVQESNGYRFSIWDYTRCEAQA